MGVLQLPGELTLGSAHPPLAKFVRLQLSMMWISDSVLKNRNLTKCLFIHSCHTVFKNYILRYLSGLQLSNRDDRLDLQESFSAASRWDEGLMGRPHVN